MVKYSTGSPIADLSFDPENLRRLTPFRCSKLEFVSPENYATAKHTANQVFEMNLHLYGGYAFTGALITRRAIKRTKAGRETFTDGNCCIPYATPSATVLFADTIRYADKGYQAWMFFGGDLAYATMVHSAGIVNVSMLDGHAQSATLSELRTKSKFIPDTGRSDYGYFYDLNGNPGATMQFRCEDSGDFTVYEDGIYLHVNGACYDKQTLEKVYDDDLYGDIGEMRNFIPLKVVYDDEKYTLVLGYHQKYYVSAVYDKTLQGYVFRGDFFSTSAYREGDIFYVHTRQRLSVLDLSSCELLAENIGSEVFALGEQSTARIFDNAYLDAVSDGKYIYTIDLTKALFVYDVSALSLVKKVDLPFTPQCMDLDGNKIAVGFEDARQFTLIDTDTWVMQTVTADCMIEEICVYGNRIVYASKENWSAIYVYDCDKKITKRILDSYSEATIAVNKADGILYIGERGISSSDLVYYDLQKEEIVYQSTFGLFGYNYFRIHFDGENVHYCGLMLDKLTGKRYYGEQYIQMFPEEVASDVQIEGCVYFDGVYSVMVVTRNKEKFTWVYNKETGSVREIPYETSNVIRTDEVLILVMRGTETLVVTAL